MSDQSNRLPIEKKLEISFYVKDNLARYEAERMPRKAVLGEVNRVMGLKLSRAAFYALLKQSGGKLAWNWKQDPKGGDSARGRKRLVRIAVIARAVERLYREFNLELPEEFRRVNDEAQTAEAEGRVLAARGTTVSDEFRAAAEVEARTPITAGQSRQGIPNHLPRSARGNVTPANG